METNEIFTALACLVPALLIGLAAALVYKIANGPAPLPAPAAPIPVPAAIPMQPVAMPSAAWRVQQYDSLGDTLQSFLAAKNAAAQQQPPPGRVEAHREAPARPASVASDVTVPFLQALISGIFPAIGVAAIAAACKGDWVLAFLITFSVVDCVIWFIGWLSHRKLLWVVEKWTHTDLDGDGNQGKPPAVEHDFTIADQRQGHKTIWRTRFPGDLAMLRNFASRVVDGEPFTEKSATDAGYTSFEALRDMFLLNKWADWRNQRAHTQGVKLEDVGKQILEQMASTPIDEG